MITNRTPTVLDLTTVDLPSTTLGPLAGVRHAHVRDRLWRALHHKRWYYFSVADSATFLGCSIVDLGYLCKGFVYLVDRPARRMLIHRQSLLPGGPWCRVERSASGPSGARFRSPTLGLRFTREASGAFSLKGSARGLRFSLVLAPSGEPIVAANTLPTAATSATEKGLAYHVRGNIEAAGRRFDMQNAFGGSDFTDGYLPRHTLWRWANVSAAVAGHDFGLNLVQGYMGACECVALVDGEVTSLGEGIIDRPANPMDHWRVRTACHRVDLKFAPVAMHEDATDLGVIHAKFHQPIGTYSGRVLDLAIDDALGVCEDQDVLW
ncbi:MAG: DUF2804 domain-containing protein [Deltaproteobacteria bacterium]|nr:DUF2804 domain-containing protein [Deltaproteobacteria bacterium]